MVIEIGSTVMILIYLAFAMGLANVCLLLELLNSYWKTYKEIKSEFTIGLLYFGSFLLIQNILVTLALVGSINSSCSAVCDIQFRIWTPNCIPLNQYDPTNSSQHPLQNNQKLVNMILELLLYKELLIFDFYLYFWNLN